MIDEDEAQDFFEKEPLGHSRETTGLRIREAEEVLVFTGSRPLGAVWLTLVAVMAGVLGGVFPTGSLWRPIWPALAWIVVLPIAWLGMRRVTQAVFGLAGRWQAVLAFFWAFLLSMAAVGSGQISNWWVSYGLSLGLGLFIGLPFGITHPRNLRIPDAWMGIGFPLAGASAVIGTYAYRRMLPDASIETAALAGGLCALTFTAPMMAMLMKLWDISKGVEKVAAICLEHDAHTARAIEFLNVGIRLSPANAHLYNLRAIAFSRAGDETRADADWKTAFELQPGSAEPYLFRGNDLLRQGRVDEAIGPLEKAVELAPKKARPHYFLGLAHLKRGAHDRAIECFNRAIARSPKLAGAYIRRAKAHLQAGRPQQALDDCNEALAIESDHGLAYLIRGHAFAALGRSDDAAQDYQSAWDGDSTDEQREEAEDALQKMGRQPD